MARLGAAFSVNFRGQPSILRSFYDMYTRPQAIGVPRQNEEGQVFRPPK
jgi:hypothetical protein